MGGGGELAIILRIWGGGGGEFALILRLRGGEDELAFILRLWGGGGGEFILRTGGCVEGNLRTPFTARLAPTTDGEDTKA